jgi:hypothetical protein
MTVRRPALLSLTPLPVEGVSEGSAADGSGALGASVDQLGPASAASSRCGLEGGVSSGLGDDDV